MDLTVKDHLKMLIAFIQSKESSNRNYNNPGPRLSDIMRCFEFYADNKNELGHNYFYSQMSYYISLYIASLHNVEEARIKFNSQYGDPDSNVGLPKGSAYNSKGVHIEFLSMLHEDNELLSTTLMHQYPLAWAMVDEDWCAWTKILK